MKKVTFGMCLLASAVFAVAVAQAQQSGAGAANLQDEQQGQGAIQQQPLPNQQQGLGSNQDQFGQPGAPREQAGQRLQPQQPGIDTRQNVVQPDNRFGQHRGFNYQGGAPDPLPTPAERRAQGLDAGMQADGQRGQSGTTAQGGRGELGVWLAASAGPGVEIRQVTAGSAAADIGLRAGDVLLQVMGRPVTSPMEVQQLIRAIPAGQTAMLEIWRDGVQQEVSATLQPIRESYQSGYRGNDPRPARSGDLESRTMRLEEQLSMVMRELQQLRQQMARLHPEMSSVQQAGGEIGAEQPAPQPQSGPFDRIDTTQPGPGEVEPAATQPGLFDDEPAATQPAQPEPPATEAETPATEDEPSATEDEPFGTEPADDDLFGGEPAEPEADSTPAEETETEAETETDTGSLFE